MTFLQSADKRIKSLVQVTWHDISVRVINFLNFMEKLWLKKNFVIAIHVEKIFC